MNFTEFHSSLNNILKTFHMNKLINKEAKRLGISYHQF